MRKPPQAKRESSGPAGLDRFGIAQAASENDSIPPGSIGLDLLKTSAFLAGSRQLRPDGSERKQHSSTSSHSVSSPTEEKHIPKLQRRWPGQPQAGTVPPRASRMDRPV